jgi:GNAT superfamily N-acetyltransferase
MIRNATAADLEALLDVQERASLETAGKIFDLPTGAIRHRWRDAFGSGSARFRIYESDGRIAGVAILTPPWLHALHVVPEYWGTGVAVALHDDCLEIIQAEHKEAFCRLLADNARARAFADKHGWEYTGITMPLQDPPHPLVATYWKPL